MKSASIVLLFLFTTFVHSQDKIHHPEEVDQFPVIRADFCFEDLKERDCFQSQLMDFVNGKITYPENALKEEAEGVAYVQFQVDKNGSIGNIKARSQREDFKNEALRVLGMLPKIQPALKDGKPVVFVFGFPINFTIKKNERAKIDYFPQEQLIHPNVLKDQDHNEYLYNTIQKQLTSILSQKSNLSRIRKNIKDTLSISLTFEVDDNGFIQENKNRIGINSKALREKIIPDLEKILNFLPQFQIKNRKPDPIVSTHHLLYKFVSEGKKDVELIHIPNEEKYNGGTIEEVPIFPGCEGMAQDDTRRCFQLKMQEHIKAHFAYPAEAVSKKISGRVNIVFIITKTGNIENIRTRGPHKVLEKEAVRIIQQLPRMTPGKQNGKPVNVPFSIPITFKI